MLPRTLSRRRLALPLARRLQHIDQSFTDAAYRLGKAPQPPRQNAPASSPAQAALRDSYGYEGRGDGARAESYEEWRERQRRCF